MKLPLLPTPYLKEFFLRALVGSISLFWGLKVQGQKPCEALSIQIIDSIALPVTYDHIDSDTQGNLYLLSQTRQSLVKLLKRSSYDSTFQIGGPSALPGESFLEPKSFQVNTYQKVFILDEASRSLLTWGKDLERLGQINFSQETSQQQVQEVPAPLLPSNFLVNSLGEIYLINQWDNKIYHFTSKGNYLQSFGGTDYGTGTLFSPTYLTINNKNDIFVFDSSNSHIYCYDAFGTFKHKFSTGLPKTVWGMASYRDHLFLWEGPRLHLVEYDPLFHFSCTHIFPTAIKDITFRHQYLYVLDKDWIRIYKVE
ncbi:MAG: hypothetical protein AAGA10_27335 [Bacteroidota bacterium]